MFKKYSKVISRFLHSLQLHTTMILKKGKAVLNENMLSHV